MITKEKYVKVDLTLEKEVLFWLFMEAHKKDTTFNKLVEKILKEEISRLEKVEAKKIEKK